MLILKLVSFLTWKFANLDAMFLTLSHLNFQILTSNYVSL